MLVMRDFGPPLFPSKSPLPSLPKNHPVPLFSLLQERQEGGCRGARREGAEEEGEAAPGEGEEGAEGEAGEGKEGAEREGEEGERDEEEIQSEWCYFDREGRHGRWRSSGGGWGICLGIQTCLDSFLPVEELS